MGEFIGTALIGFILVMAVIGGAFIFTAWPMKANCERDLPRTTSCVMQFVPAGDNGEGGQ